jgi:hypothetical protein
VFVVAIAELQGAIDAEAAALATDLRCTAYDARLLLAPGMPAVVRTTPEKAAALDLLSRLRARGHGAIACAAEAVVPSSAMISMRRFVLGESAAVLGDRPDETLPYDDILALIHAVHRSRVDVETRSQETKLSVSRALMTSGLSMTKTVTKESRATTESKTGVVYVFRRSGGTPWLLQERGTSWAGHGRPLAPSEAENFGIAVSALRTRAPGAVFDDRLTSRRTGERAALSGVASATGSTTVKTSSEAAVDLLAHLLGLWFARLQPPGPGGYR